MPEAPATLALLGKQVFTGLRGGNIILQRNNFEFWADLCDGPPYWKQGIATVKL